MPGTEDTLRIWYNRRPRVWLYAFPATLLFFTVATRSWTPGAWTVLTFAQVFVARRGVTMLTPTHVVTGVLRRRSVPWADVRAIRASGAYPQARAVLAYGETVALKAVYWRAPRVEGMGAPNSVQTVVEWARAHGHDVPVVEA